MRWSRPALLALALAACDGGSEPGPPLAATVASVTIASGDITLLMITVVVKDSDGNVLTGRAVTWASASPAVATVDSFGRVIGQTLGVAVITATSEGKSDTISANVIPVVVVSPRLPSLFTGDTTQLTVTLLTALRNAAGNAPVTWSVATSGTTVDAGGVVHAGTPGLVRVTASAAGGTGTVDVAVLKRPGTLTRKVAWGYFVDGHMGEIWVADADGGNAVRVSQPDEVIFGYAWSPNGDRLAISARRGTRYLTYVIAPDGTVLTEARDVWGNSPQWSPDGSTIAIPLAPYIITMNAATGAVQLLPTTLGNVTFTPRWSPDGRTIAFGSDACDKITLMNSDGTNRRDFGLPHRTCDALWSPDGKVLAYDWYPTGGDPGVFIVPATGGTPTPVSPNCLTGAPCKFPAHSAVEWRSDGYSLAIRGSEFIAYNRVTGTSTPLGTSGGQWIFGWSPDLTRAIGYFYPDGDLNSRIAVMNADLTSPQFISAPGREANWATWQPAP
jgi:WD40 repeat protein